MVNELQSVVCASLVLFGSWCDGAMTVAKSSTFQEIERGIYRLHRYGETFRLWMCSTGGRQNHRVRASRSSRCFLVGVAIAATTLGRHGWQTEHRDCHDSVTNL